MRRVFVICAATFALVCATGVLIANSNQRRTVQNTAKPLADLTGAALAAISADVASANSAIERLRAAGPAGLNALLEVRDQPGSDWQRWQAAMDRVSRQRYGYLSRLYWYTDFDRAVQAARLQNKPILSLRLLGDLTDDLSCANSRFFRTTLYANEEVSDFLRRSFVLHWQSVRPVPKVTIDFGDGRRLRTTLTGNSIHYILSRDGQPIDAVPGLYGPQAFLHHLRRGVEAAHRYSTLHETQRPAALLEHHRRQMATIDASWAADLERLGHDTAQRPRMEPSEAKTVALQRVTAIQAARIAVPKSVIEVRTIVALTQDDRSPPLAPKVGVDWLDSHTNEETWHQIATLHGDDARLDKASILLFQKLHPVSFTSDPQLIAQAQLSCSEFVPATPDVTEMVATFEKLIAMDTVRNEYLFHRRIHRWFADNEVDGLDALNERVYNELFLTPRSDPWLGLTTEGAFTALPNGGLEIDQ